MLALGWVPNIFRRGAASMGRLNYILRAQPQIDDRHAAVAANAPLAGEIEFRNLTFTFPTNISGNGAAPPATASNGGHGSRPPLRAINLKIPAGSTLPTAGPTAR